MSNERKPLLSDDDLKSLIISDPDECDWDADHDLSIRLFVAKDIRGAYEDLLTKGELRTVKACSLKVFKDPDFTKCNTCGHEARPSWHTAKFCAGCGDTINP
jgi:hypothetical protein